jgi:hypothetical protein
MPDIWSDPAERAVTAFAMHKVTGPFDPERDRDNSARQTIADTIREVEQRYGPVRVLWPRKVLQAAAPYDALAQLAAGKTIARRVYTRPPDSALHPHDVRVHRPHNPNAGSDWRPVVEPDDGGAS